MLRREMRLSRRQIKKVVAFLTKKTYSHSHLIGRNEAKEKIGLGSMIEFADKDTYDLMEKLYEHIESDLSLSDPLDFQEELRKAAPNPAKIDAVPCLVQSEKLNFEGKSNIIILPNGQVPPPSFKWHLL